MSNNQPNNPLHGVTLEKVVVSLVERYGLSGPGRLPQKLQAGLHRRIISEAIDINSSAQLLPAIAINKAYHHFLKSDAVQRVVGLFIGHCLVYL